MTTALVAGCAAGGVGTALATPTATYHLHGEVSANNAERDQLKTAGPDAASQAMLSGDDQWGRPASWVLLGRFDTQPGDPNASGTIPAGSTVSWTLRMRKTANTGTVSPTADLYVANANGSASLMCESVETPTLTTTVTAYAVTCTTAADITLTTSQQFYTAIWVYYSGDATASMKPELDIEGTTDSTVQIPVPAPTLTSISPTSGPVGTAVTVSGTNFWPTQGSSTFVVHDVAATPTSWSATSIVAPVPAAAASGVLRVTVNGAAISGPFTVTPALTGLSPMSGPVGTPVTITGTTFGASQGTNTVTFHGTTATPTSWGSSSITVPVPSAATTGIVVVTVDGSASNGSTFTVTPGITTAAPASGPTGTSVTVTGTNFGATQGASTVKFNGTTATPTAWSNTSITVPVPSAATTGNLIVTVGGLASNALTFSVAPAITSRAPTSGAVGTSVTLTGTTFGATQGASTVTFNGTTATPTSWGNTSITVPVPAGATTGNVVVTVGGLASSGVSFSVPPAITTLSPSAGAVGASVTVTGTTFGATQGTSTIKFNGTTATPTSWSSTSITVPVPSAATTGTVVVTVGGLASNGVSFSVPPAITNLSPTSGVVGTSVTLTGTTFGATKGTSTVTFNGTTATPSSWSNTSIVVPVPSGATTGVVVATVGGLASNGVSFTLTPSITSLSPTSGAVGTSVTIAGSNFGTTQGTSTVTFNGTTAAPTSWSNTSITAPVPAGATTGPVVVTVNGVASAGVTFSVAPAITTLSPTSGAVGTSVTITGTTFGATKGASTVTFNGTTATPTSWSNTSIVVPVPAAATTGNLVVTVGGLASSGVTFSVAPAITNRSPTSGAVGTAVTLTGTTFGATQGSSTVTFNGTAATPTSWSNTSISVPVPAGATTGNVVVTVGGIASNGVSFSVPPAITTVSPSAGAVGTAVTLTGTTFGATQGSSTIKFNGTTATPTSWSATSITVPVPSAATTGNVVVTVGGLASNGVSFSVPPAITTLSPTFGLVATSVTITGTTFGATKGSSTVTFNGTSATPGSWSNTSIVVPVPAGATTGNVVVTVGGLASNGVTFTLTPSITSLSPTSGALGASVTIAGSNFGATQGTSAIAFNGTTAAPTSWSNASITAPVPSGATTGPVVVTVNGVASAGVTFAVAPAITTVSPTSGPIATSVTISGTTFGATQGTSTVTFNGVAATPTSWSNTSIVAPVPAGATAGPVVVTVNGLASNGSSFSVPPAITSVSPSSGAVGASVTITGTTFGGSQGSSVVTFNGAATTPTAWSAGSITVPVPSGATSGSIVVTVNALPSNAASFGVAPAISTVSPASGPVGTAVTITGTTFGAAQGGSAVTFNGTAASPTTWSPTSLAVPVPSGATTGAVVVTAGGLASNSGTFTVLPTPTITSLSPSMGLAGTTVFIAGTQFGTTQSDSSVTVGSAVADIVDWSDTGITAAIPTTAQTGAVVVHVNGLASNGATFTVVVPPAITVALTPTPNAAGWNRAPVTAHFTCVDGGAGIDSCPADQVIATEGANQYVSGSVTDTLGNSAFTSTTVSLDLTPPTLTVVTPASASTLYVPNVAITATLSDAPSGPATFTCGNASGSIAGGTATCAVTLVAGTNGIAIVATDAAGNTASATLPLTYLRRPQVTLSAPSNLSYTNTTPTTVSGTIDDPTATVVVNGIATTNAGGSFSLALPLAEGPNTITAVATVSTGAAGTASLETTLDTTPPHVTIVTPTDQFVTSDATIAVAGSVNDIVVGTVNDQDAQVTVNGVPAQVANRTFLATNVPLTMGSNVIQALGRDRVGNFVTTSIHVTRQAPSQARIALVSGNNQTAVIGTPVSAPLVVVVTDATGPVANKGVIFKVQQNDGLLSAAGSAPAATLIAMTNGQGQAQVSWTLGHRAGAGGNIVEAYAVGYAGTAVFTATGTQSAPAMIVVDAGNEQVGAIGEPLPKPFIAVVTDAGHNRLGGVPVTFTLQQGGGSFTTDPAYTTVTDSDGRAAATLTLGQQEGNANNVVIATFPSNPGFPAVFAASGRAPGNPAQTTVTGVVLDNANQPIQGVTVRAILTTLLHSSPGAVATAPSATTDGQGQFTIAQAPVGTTKLLVDGSTAQRPGVYPSIEYDLSTVAGQANTVGQPMYLLPIDTSHQLCVTDTTGGGTLTLPDSPGFSLTFAPGQVTFPGGSKTGCVSVTTVHGDKVPMVPGFGQQPNFIVTIQPAGAVFDPPAAITMPNVDGLLPRAVTELYSFDHDISSFVAIGTGVVSDDGQSIRSSAGVGVLKAGWHCGGNSTAAGTAATCPVCQFCAGQMCLPLPNSDNRTCRDGSINGICYLGTCQDPQLRITQPGEGDIVHITGEPKMPPITAHVELDGISPDPTAGLTFSWNLGISYTLAGRTIALPSPLNLPDDVSGGSYAPDLQDVIRGGDGTLSASVHFSGQFLAATVNIKVIGDNPAPSAVRTELLAAYSRKMAGIAEPWQAFPVVQLACRENSLRQFANNGTPAFTVPDSGIGAAVGIMQLYSPPPSDQAVFDWKQNISEGLDILRSKWTDAITYMTSNQRTGEGLIDQASGLPYVLLEAMKEYNGGHYWTWNSSTAQWDRSEPWSQTCTVGNARREHYVYDVLHTSTSCQLSYQYQPCAP